MDHVPFDETVLVAYTAASLRKLTVAAGVPVPERSRVAVAEAEPGTVTACVTDCSGTPGTAGAAVGNGRERGGTLNPTVAPPSGVLTAAVASA
jgi:hypothetical protein